jgi:hypothetical protein
MSGGHGRQLDDRILAQRRDGFQRHVARPLHRPFVVLLEQDGADQADELDPFTRSEPARKDRLTKVANANGKSTAQACFGGIYSTAPCNSPKPTSFRMSKRIWRSSISL